MIGDITKDTKISAYQPLQDVVELTKNVKRDYSMGYDILHTSYVELNDYSPIDRANKDQKTFNSYVEEGVEDPKDAWRFRGTRSLARNKAMAMHAHLTAGYIVPTIIAQNEQQKEDQEFSDIMRDILEWMTINSNYRPSFLLAAQGMLVNPVTYLEADFCEVFQTIIEREEKGFTRKEILDEILSGFQANVLSIDQVLITNVHEQNIQKQRAIIKTKNREYSELEAKWGDHPNWQYLQPGIKTVFSEETGMFYDTVDTAHPTIVQENTWLCRREDSEVVFLNGIYFGNEDVENNPINHRDNRNAPKYNITPFGYERINEHFFFFKSMINRVGWDNDLIDAMWEVHMNRSLLDADQPLFVSGEENVDSGIVFPGSVATSANRDTKVSPILPAYSGILSRTINEAENSMSSNSISESEMGQLPSEQKTATATAKASRSAQILLSGMKQNFAESIRQFGSLMIDVALQHLTIPQIDEISGDLNYRSFLLSDQTVNGKKVSKRIRFDESLLGKKMSAKQRRDRAVKLLNESGYPDNKEHLYLINPHLFSKFKYLSTMEVENMEVKTREFKMAMMERLNTMIMNNPKLEGEAWLRELLQSYQPYMRTSVDNLISKQVQQVMGKSPVNLPGMPAEMLQ